MDDTFLVWFTGFYEGEGSITSHASRRNSLYLSVSQNDPVPLEMAQGRWGGSVVKRVRRSPASDKICTSHEWRIYGKPAELVALAIRPYMCIPYKIQQLESALARSHEPWTNQYPCSQCASIFADRSSLVRHQRNKHSSSTTVRTEPDASESMSLDLLGSQIAGTP